MVKDQLIELVQDEITASGAISTSIGIKEIDRIINDAARWFYQNYQYAVETVYYILPKATFDSVWKSNRRQIVLPDCVVSVLDVKEMKSANFFGMVDRDITENRLIAAELYLAPFGSDDLVYRTAQYAYYDLTRAYFLERIQFSFNQNTHHLTLLGRNPIYDVSCRVMTKIPEQSLYDDPLFIDYVKGKALISMARVYSFISMSLPGGAQINASVLESQGTQMVDKVLEKIDSENVPDYFLQIH
jgi:hypothetical protein